MTMPRDIPNRVQLCFCLGACLFLASLLFHDILLHQQTLASGPARIRREAEKETLATRKAEMFSEILSGSECDIKSVNYINKIIDQFNN